MTAVSLPALRADSALGFLAAIGATRMLRDELGESPRVGWPDGPYSGAVMESSNGDVEALAAAIAGIASEMRERGELLPGVAGFPPVEAASSHDPVKDLLMGDGRGLAARALDDIALDRWSHAVVGMVAPIDRTTGLHANLAVSRFLQAGPGKVRSSSTLRKALARASEETLIGALTGWRRVDGYIGAYLDAQADVEKATGQASKDPPKRGVPGATFLALMALPLFPVRTPQPFKAETAGWAERRGTRKGFMWPVWEELLTLESITGLLDHRAVAATLDGATEELSALGLTAVFRSTRLATPNYDGALGPAKLIWAAGG